MTENYKSHLKLTPLAKFCEVESQIPFQTPIVISTHGCKHNAASISMNSIGSNISLVQTSIGYIDLWLYLKLGAQDPRPLASYHPLSSCLVAKRLLYHRSASLRTTIQRHNFCATHETASNVRLMHLLLTST